MERRGWGISGPAGSCGCDWKHAANGVMQSKGSAPCRSSLYLVRAELLCSQPGSGTLMERKKQKGAAISKVRLVQQSFGVELVLVTHHGLRGKPIVFCLFGHRCRFSVSVVVVV